MRVAGEGISERRSKALQRTLPYCHVDRSSSFAAAQRRHLVDALAGVTLGNRDISIALRTSCFAPVDMTTKEENARLFD